MSLCIGFIFEYGHLIGRKLADGNGMRCVIYLCSGGNMFALNKSHLLGHDFDRADNEHPC